VTRDACHNNIARWRSAAARRIREVLRWTASWARRSKMRVVPEKTQMLVLSHWAPDAIGCTIKMAGKSVTAGDNLNLLGVTLDRMLHFGPHCKKLRGRTRPRIGHLRQLTG